MEANLMTARYNSAKDDDSDKILFKSEHAFRSLVENAFVGIAISDLRGRLKYVNKALAELLGYSVSELLNQPFKNFIHPADRRKVMRLFLRIIMLRREPRQLEFRSVRRDGNVLNLWSKPSRFIVNGRTVGFQAIIVDITELKIMEKKLKETNRKLEMFLETAMEGITIVDSNDNLSFVNKAFAGMLGYEEEELLGANLRKLVDKEGFEKIRKETEARKKGVTSRYEIKLYCKNGDPRIVQVSASPFWDADGNFAGTLAIIMDVTERKKMEEKLRQSEEKFRGMAERSFDAIAIVNLEGNITYASPSVGKVLGYPQNEVVGKSFLEYFSPDTLSNASQLFADLMQGKSLEGLQLELPRKDGTIATVEINAAPIIMNSKVTGIQAVFRNVTERKKMEERLRESEERLRSLIEYAPDAIYINDLNGKILEGNRQAEILTGYEKEELIGKSILEAGLLPEKYVPKTIEAIQKNLSGQRTGPDEFELIRKDGSRVFVEISTIPIKIGQRIEILGIARDITERKQMQKKLEEYSQHLEALVEQRTRQLKKAQEKLIKSERLAAIGEVAAMVGHDLRNPLTGIKGATYYLKTKLYSKMGEKTKEMLELIEADIEYANKIITDLLEYSREVHLELTETNPKTIITETLHLIKVPENIQIINRTRREPKIRIDIEKMTRVFHNLVINAIDAMPNGGKLTITSRKTKDAVKFIFKDTGIGMTRETMEKIFTPFFTTKAKGMGLGLPICKHIVEAHGGKITVDSAVSEGATFTLTLPIKSETKEEGGEKTWISVPESLSLTTTKASEKS
ncbi:MAG: PAS domain S-box protein [Candidatus Bathyarchaeota archaeon]|nr:PAS domain S-box protein [Candidatus Bathyarchaeota archaeon]